MAEKVGKEQIKREKGYLYYLGKDGYLWKTPTKLNKSGKKARVVGVEVAGKTGTSQVVKMGEDRARANRGSEVMRDHAWFIAFAPVEAPEIAIACIVEHAGGGGGAIAAPVVQQILTHYFTRTEGPTVPPPVEAAAHPGPAPRSEADAIRPTIDHPL